MLDVRTCIVCSTEITPAVTGRPRKYCSNACRLTAQRARRGAAIMGVMVGGMPEPGVADLQPAQVLAALPADPDEAVVQSIKMARGAAAAFGASAVSARPQLAWRCERAGSEIAATVRKYFTP